MEICYEHSFGIYFPVSNNFIFVLHKHVKQFSIMRNMTQQEYQTTSMVITISDGRVLPSKYSVLRIDLRNRHQNIFAIGTLLIIIWTKPSSNRLLSLISLVNLKPVNLQPMIMLNINTEILLTRWNGFVLGTKSDLWKCRVNTVQTQLSVCHPLTRYSPLKYKMCKLIINLSRVHKNSNH